MKRLLFAVLVGLCAVASAVGVKNLDARSHLAGPSLVAGDLVGKVILIEFFGHGCGPCEAAMPGTVAMVERIRAKDARLVAVASHVWPRSDARVQRFFERVGGAKLPAYQEFIVEGVAVPRGVPHAVVVDGVGKVVWEGHPVRHEEMERAILDALGRLNK